MSPRRILLLCLILFPIIFIYLTVNTSHEDYLLLKAALLGVSVPLLIFTFLEFTQTVSLNSIIQPDMHLTAQNDSNPIGKYIYITFFVVIFACLGLVTFSAIIEKTGIITAIREQRELSLNTTQTATPTAGTPGVTVEPDRATPTPVESLPASESTPEPATLTPQKTVLPEPTLPEQNQATQPVPDNNNPAPARVNERTLLAGIALTIRSVSTTDSVNDLETPQPGNYYIVVEVLLENDNRAEETPYDAYYFSLQDSNGNVYDLNPAAPEPSLASGTLIKGDQVSGYIAYEVPTTASGLILTYEPETLFDGFRPIQIDLGQ
jgi:hypothetical protein